MLKALISSTPSTGIDLRSQNSSDTDAVKDGMDMKDGPAAGLTVDFAVYQRFSRGLELCQLTQAFHPDRRTGSLPVSIMIYPSRLQ